MDDILQNILNTIFAVSSELIKQKRKPIISDELKEKFKESISIMSINCPECTIQVSFHQIVDHLMLHINDLKANAKSYPPEYPSKKSINKKHS